MDDDTFVHSIRVKDINGVQLLEMDRDQVLFSTFEAFFLWIVFCLRSLGRSLLNSTIDKTLKHTHFPLLAQMAELGLSVLRQRKVLMKGLVLLNVEKGVWRPKDELSFTPSNHNSSRLSITSPNNNLDKSASPLSNTSPICSPTHSPASSVFTKKISLAKISRKFTLSPTSPRKAGSDGNG